MATGMKLFVLLQHLSGPMVLGPDGKPLYFTSKSAAKARRDKSKGQVIGLGPDHHRYSANLRKD